jgi:adenylyl-sulfate kinase
MASPAREVPALAVSDNVTWQDSAIGREERWRRLGLGGATVWFTGLPASGKSTLAAAVEERLVSGGRFAYRLDGDNLRHGVSGDLGFSPCDRDENVRRVGAVAQLFADAGAIALVSLVSPYRASRRLVRELHEQCGLPFVEVFVNTPVDECARRDPKGLYARAHAGELTGLTGVDDPYEEPLLCELEITPSTDLDAATRAVIEVIDSRVALG